MHPALVRVTHWINAAAMIIMIMSGWKIYNDEVIFGFLYFPEQIVLGIWAQHALQWHFLGMWILVLNGLVYLGFGIATGRFRRLLLPIRPGEVVRDVLAAARFRLGHADLTTYNAVQKVLYLGILMVIVLQVVTGLVIWKPVQFAAMIALFGDFQGARLAHFIGMSAIVLFLAVHVALALLVPKTILAMLTGGERLAAPRKGGAVGATPADQR
jgi:thiosulfate reductase cytochrome b subunit